MEETETVSLRICQEGHANALALNKDCTQIAVAGRSLLKVFAIDNDGFAEVCNMRGGKNQNLSYSSNDVSWSTLDTNILATAATNGVVSVWDLSKFGRQKQLIVYNEHERTAHTVTFHSTEPNILISGSQDGTIKCFDLRYDKSVNTYFSNSESVRDVKFSPHTSNIFSAVSENGTVQLWDLRRWDKCILQFTAHSGPIYTCDWHTTKNWLATGSRDKQIKVWNMDGKASLEHTIHTIAVVGRVKWRPERTYHIASCALVVDYSIHVWDIRRPYIPFASFNDHTNVTTDIAWKGGNSHCLLSTSKDSTIFKHAFKDASRPALKANAQGISLGRRGNISFANKVRVYAPQSAAQVVKTNSLITREKSFTGMEKFHIAQSDMCEFQIKSSMTGYEEPNGILELKEHEAFIGCAKELQFGGKKLSEVCEHNASVCRKFGKHDASTLWTFVKSLYGTNDFNRLKYEQRNSFSNQKNAQALRRPTQVVNNLVHDALSWEHNEQLNDGSGNDGDIDNEAQDSDALNMVGGGGDGVRGKQNTLPWCSVVLSETQVLSEITFENFDLLRNGFIFVGPPDYSKVLSFPETALHHDVQAARPQLDLKNEDKKKSPPPNVPRILKVASRPVIPIWEPHQFMADALTTQTDAMGDVQNALAILAVLGEARKLLPLDDALIEHWFQTYIDQLQRYQLYNEASTVINLSWLRSIRQLSEKSTTVHTNCGDCGRPLGSSAGWCQKCRSTESAHCCICGLIVRGVFAWCQGCSHGGHIEHLMNYFVNRSKCPKCGHLCEYN